MKKLVFTGLLVVVLTAVVILAGCTAPGSGGSISGGTFSLISSNQQEGIVVNGTGKVTAVPDLVNLSLGVESRESTVAQAQTNAAKAMNEITNVLKRNNIAEKDIKTQQFNISPIFEFRQTDSRSIITGYVVSNIINVKIRDIAKAGTVIDQVAAAGGDLTRINNISFSVDDPTKYYTEARQKAMEDAQNKAKQLASLGGVSLGKPNFISENSFVNLPVINFAREAVGAPDLAPAAPPTEISPGETDITLNVQVTYTIVR